MTTLSPEAHAALDALCNRINNSQDVSWYALSISLQDNYHDYSGIDIKTWWCYICNNIIYESGVMVGSGSKLYAHGINHLKEHNLLAFI